MRRITGFLSAAALSVNAPAQSPSDVFEVCAQKADPVARLACFDQEIQRRHATSALREAPIADAAVKEPPKPIVAQVVRSMSRPDHRYTIVLDNGQVWEQVDSRQGLYIGAHETVTISSAALGSFFLETSKRQNCRVRRLQ
jgi:hypothetical protein